MKIIFFNLTFSFSFICDVYAKKVNFFFFKGNTEINIGLEN